MSAVLVLYHSQEYGNTKKMAEAVAEGAETSGATVTLVNTNEERLDVDRYRNFDAVAFGSPDYFGYVAGGLKTFLDDWYIARKADPAGLSGKPVGLFFSHGGGGTARDPLEALYGRLGTQIGDTIESLGEPDASVLDACRALGGKLAEAANAQGSQ